MNIKISKTIGLVLGVIGLMIPILAYAQATSDTAATPVATQTALGEVTTFGDFVSLVWNYGSQVIIALAVLFIVVGAFFYVASMGNEERINQGKQMIFGSLIAVAIVIFSGVLIRTLHTPTQNTSGYLSDVPTVIQNATNILVGSIGAFAVLMMIYAGFLYVTAQGETEKITKATSALRYAIIGLVVGALAYVIVNNVVNYFL
jgi:glucose uptake protein GlcU